ncbi:MULTISPECIES: hypothetical protein [Virgibacillus]|uniref:Uncharacterized protein n=2 Tax=Virgibacillus TaxID=84406 RepID=A0A024QA63_9BACI|nr:MULTISPECIES: hypothetical protein [Virgibacillus]EQB35797.1 hypothetical protein M948_12215 [Virgibacillus sp. CM-4]GGJ49570.1 hypothetical protein GCM10007111_09630 [Virgibacillus kapii]CDQ39408.1 hypothetical protein BN990_01708 [Virgibacillus massiliensis]
MTLVLASFIISRAVLFIVVKKKYGNQSKAIKNGNRKSKYAT